MASTRNQLPFITDDDANLIGKRFGLEIDEPRREFLTNMSTVDVSACPGSGKTTLLVAKLALLLEKWPYSTKGVCVLSHTNVAREEIEQRIGTTSKGRELLGYPHFIGTIHAFVNKFLALPWLYANGYPVTAIDNIAAGAYRQARLDNERKYITLKCCFGNQKPFPASAHQLQFTSLKFEPRLTNRKRFPAGKDTDSYRQATRLLESSARAGFFCHDEMFVFANALLDQYPDLYRSLNARFPLVLIDEMQDTQNEQMRVLERVFPRDNDASIVQRLGDPNQTVFDSEDEGTALLGRFPDSNAEIVIPNSFRFGREIAAFASPFAVNKVGTTGLIGRGPKGGGLSRMDQAHAIFIFPNDRAEDVLAAYAAHILDVLPDEVIARGPAAAVGAVHMQVVDERPEHYPKTVAHYWRPYSSAVATASPKPRNLAEHFLVAQNSVKQNGNLAAAVRQIAAGLARLGYIAGECTLSRRQNIAHRSITKFLLDKPEILQAYRQLLIKILIEQETLTRAFWEENLPAITNIAIALCEGDYNADRCQRFLAWPDDESWLGTISALNGGKEKDHCNAFRYCKNGREVEIKLGSIHSVKGQTHIATLVLSTFYKKHSSDALIDWLLGNKTNAGKEGTENRKRLFETYVAMTRPSHLLCLAVRRSALEKGKYEDNVQLLLDKGWRVAELNDGITRWRDI